MRNNHQKLSGLQNPLFMYFVVSPPASRVKTEPKCTTACLRATEHAEATLFAQEETDARSRWVVSPLTLFGSVAE